MFLYLPFHCFSIHRHTFLLSSCWCLFLPCDCFSIHLYRCRR
jgi:hypothetical protein